MFNITGGELIIIAVVALIILGPDKLPDFIRRAGRVYGEVKKMSTGFKTEFRGAIEEPVREMQETVNIAKNWFEEGKTAVETMDGSRWGDPDDSTPSPAPSVAPEVSAAPIASAPDDDGLPLPAYTPPGPGSSTVAPADVLDAVDDDADDDTDDGLDDDPNLYDDDGRLVSAADLLDEHDAPPDPATGTSATDAFGNVVRRAEGEGSTA